MLASQKLGAERKMGTSYRVRIGLREIQAMQPNTILWDQEVRGFVARRQFSDIVTFSVVYRTRERAALAEAGALPDLNAAPGTPGSD
jgi:hypothetical protein